VPLSDSWAFDNGPGEIWDLAGEAANNNAAKRRDTLITIRGLP